MPGFGDVMAGAALAARSTGPVLLYDGACGFCSRAVGLVLRHDRRGTLRFASLQGPFAAALVPRHAELVGVDSLVWVEPVPGVGERVFVRSAAVLRVAAYLGSWWRVFFAAWAVPRALRDGAYELVARHRHRILGADGRCFVPPPAARARFLDGG